MLPLPFYYTLLGLCWIYALVKGGRPERIGAAVVAAGSVLCLALVLGRADRYKSVEIGVLLVDIALFAIFTLLALRADRFWPIWASALAGLGVLGHLGRWYLGPDIGRGAYVISIVLWSYPILMLIAIGTLNHHRRVAREGRSRYSATIAPRAKA
jgi:hypothetical protein